MKHNKLLRLKRLQYRSMHRGCKETDLILGEFSKTHLPTLHTEELDAFEALLDEDDVDIWNWLVGKTDTPTIYQALVPTMRAIKLPI